MKASTGELRVDQLLAVLGYARESLCMCSVCDAIRRFLDFPPPDRLHGPKKTRKVKP